MLEVARRILAEAGRPLSARKILELAEQAGGAGTPLDLAGLREALEGAPGVKEVRRGVFGLVEEAPPAPVVEADDSDSEDRKRRRRRPKAKELLGDEPVAALSVEDAVAQAEAAVDTESHRRTLWTQVRDRAAAAVTDEALPPVPQLAPPVEDEGRAGRGRRARQEGRGRRSERGGDEPLAAAPVAAAPVVAAPVVAAPVVAAPVAPVAKAPPVAKAAPRAVEKAREEAPRIDKPRENAKESKSLRDALRARLKAWASALPKVVKVAIPKPEPLTPTPRKVADNSAADILARLSARRRVRPAQAVPQPVVAAPVVAAPVVAAPVVAAPVVAAPVVAAPVVAAPVVAAPVAAAAPPREETRPPRPAEEGLAAQVRGVLLAEDRTASMRRIAERLGEEAGAVRAAVVADNARHAAAGQRSLFVLLPDGSVGLSEWTLTERYLDLEEKIQHALAEQEEMVRRDLLDRVANLSDAAFEQVVTLLLERLGHDDVRTVHRQGSTLALLTHRDGEPVAIVARRARSVVGLETVQALEASLPRFHADRGLLVTVGEFDDKARQAARKASVQLLDGAAFARALYTHDIGVSRHQPTFRYPDAAFFAGLG